MLNDGISIGAIVAVNLHDNHIISHFIFTMYITHTSPIHYPNITQTLPIHYPYITQTLPIHYPYITHTLPKHSHLLRLAECLCPVWRLPLMKTKSFPPSTRTVITAARQGTWDKRAGVRYKYKQ